MDHQLINMKDKIPTPSHPTRSCIKLPAVARVSMEIRKISRCFWNFVVGSLVIYHVENSIIDHVTNRAVGKNSVEYLLIMSVIVIFVMPVLIRWKLTLMFCV